MRKRLSPLRVFFILYFFFNNSGLLEGFWLLLWFFFLSVLCPFQWSAFFGIYLFLRWTPLVTRSLVLAPRSPPRLLREAVSFLTHFLSGAGWPNAFRLFMPHTLYASYSVESPIIRIVASSFPHAFPVFLNFWLVAFLIFSPSFVLIF